MKKRHSAEQIGAKLRQADVALGQIPNVRVGLHLGEVTKLDQVREGKAKIVGLAIDMAARMSLVLKRVV